VTLNLSGAGVGANGLTTALASPVPTIELLHVLTLAISSSSVALQAVSPLRLSFSVLGNVTSTALAVALLSALLLTESVSFSDFGADFYGLPRNDSRIRLARRDWSPPANYPYSKDGAGKLVPMRAGESVRWQLVP